MWKNGDSDLKHFSATEKYVVPQQTVFKLWQKLAAVG